MKDIDIQRIRADVILDDDPVVAACAIIGAMAGVVSIFADRDMAVEALRSIAADIELAHKAAERRERPRMRKDSGA